MSDERITPEALLSIVSDLSHALYIVTACPRCWGTGTVSKALGPDECPVCLGQKSAFPNALKQIEKAAARCEALSKAKARP